MKLSVIVAALVLVQATHSSAQRTSPTLSADIYADVIDHTRFDSLWRASKRFGKISTAGVSSEPYTSYCNALASADPDPFYVDSRLAFWVNAYLAMLMYVMQKRVGYRSTVWDSLLLKRDTFIIARAPHTLSSLADTIVATANTVRIRAFLSTGSSNAPPFPTGACFAKSMKTSMRDQLRRVVRSERFVLYDPSANVLQLAVFFHDWIAAMEQESGSVVDFLLPWLTEAAAAQLALRKEGMQIVVSDRIETWKRAR